MRKLYQHLPILFLATFSFLQSTATHIKGGQISYRMIDSRTVEFTFVGYRSVNGVVFNQGMFDFGDGVVFGDDQGEEMPWVIEEEVVKGVEKWKLVFTHQYAANGEYLVSYSEDYRTPNSNNLVGAVNTSFYVEASVLLDPFVGGNSSPLSKFEPNFFAVAGKRLVAGFSMLDNEGDSLSYTILKPKQAKDFDVNGYRTPADPSFYESAFGNEEGDAEAIFSIDRLSSTLVWDAPGRPGDYTIAIRTQEWREINGKYVSIGFTVLDYEILVVAFDSFYDISVPVSDCHSSFAGFQGQIVIENASETELGIQFCSAISGLKFNGLSWVEWNETFVETKFSDPFTNVDVTLDAESAQELSGLNSVSIQVTSKNTVMDEFGASFEQDIPIVTGFNIGIDCDLEKLILLPVEEEHRPVVLGVSKTNVSIVTDFSSEAWLSIYDVNGKLLLDTNSPLKLGINTVDFNFVLQTPYFVILHHKKGTVTEKVLLTK